MDNSMIAEFGLISPAGWLTITKDKTTAVIDEDLGRRLNLPVGVVPRQVLRDAIG
jgi:hypothetical protein